MRYWNAALVVLCCLWVLALLWIGAPSHDVVAVLLSSQMAAWVQAFGAIAAVIAVVGLAHWELDRTNRQARRADIELVDTLAMITTAALEATSTLHSEARLRGNMGLPMFEQIRSHRQQFDHLSATVNRMLLGRPAGASLILLAEGLLQVLSTNINIMESPIATEGAAARITSGLTTIAARAVQLRTEI